jgi:DNA-binding MarR family transcriptional regulator
VPRDFFDEYLPYLLQRADQIVSREFHRELAGKGIEVSEWRVLAVLHEVGPTSITDVAIRTMLPQPTASHAVRRLVERGDVTSTQSDGDRRQRVVTLTRSGRALARRLVTSARRHEAAALGDADATRLRTALRTLVSDIEG